MYSVEREDKQGAYESKFECPRFFCFPIENKKAF